MEEQKPVRRGEFNDTFFLPALDLIMFILLIYLGGWYYYNRWGVERIATSDNNFRQEQLANQAVMDGLEADLEAARDSVVYHEEVRRQKGDEIVALGEAIENENQKIQEARQTDQMLTQVILDMNTRIRSSEEQLRTKRRDLEDRKLEIESLQDDTAELEAALADTLEARRRLQNMIADLQRERRKDPVSIFPLRASLDSRVEMGTGEQEIYAVSLAGVLTSLGNVDVGVTGGLGLSGQTDESVKEGGFFANIPLAFRRASLDLTGGISGITNATGESSVSPHAGAMLRYAPIRKERFFFLAGTNYRDEDLNFQLGLGFGRR